MDKRPLLPEDTKNWNIERRIELVLDLTRRLDLLNDLLRTAQARRCATDVEVALVVVNQAEFEAMLAEMDWLTPKLGG